MEDDVRTNHPSTATDNTCEVFHKILELWNFSQKIHIKFGYTLCKICQNFKIVHKPSGNSEYKFSKILYEMWEKHVEASRKSGMRCFSGILDLLPVGLEETKFTVNRDVEKIKALKKPEYWHTPFSIPVVCKQGAVNTI